MSILSRAVRHPLIAPLVLAGTVFLAHPLTSPARAQSLEQFANMSWTQKVNLARSTGAQYRRDCTAVYLGQATSCWHVTERVANGVSLVLRAQMAGPTKQWCLANYGQQRMECIEQRTGQNTTFVLIDGNWRAIR